ncbi:helix-turn-helix domain-containing GNAT family N-acetyltransferase [Rhodoplanes sp. TEM]|uniref:Helix-turn-helix domain-containing GNAT family N-acetyltransferase n=1 Tax=Rhodoplanes tepidamans TaxID=200616 RepID=A0ABT5JIR1_RHOTP|nr:MULTISPECIES: helix-turn-helix domain-containing GNAT family N-acetyltransferase [Rhodoplanes]MDC7789492.1 helix-turn-helix domain-containing GNAT family N-acetyltransferase [Rhodoplanes tepidamans]MDC7986122.1 helix-turn-helix domain-containing GNAT family N-acetyltransferase [Rhodoplanes sp. TEM]MDQ0358909.1 DNA-binding MarR family transcriptional regulator/GNAT superfamily N-acetyltransferase [Rhodoplanes tepidamans]
MPQPRPAASAVHDPDTATLRAPESPAAQRPPAARLDAVRRFNRAYTRRIGLLQDGLVDTPFSLTEARVIYEIAQIAETAPGTTATAIATELGLDHGYLSRILKRFEKAGLVARRPSPQDGRQSLLALTPDGTKTFAELVRRSRDQVAAMLAGLPEASQQRLVAAMRTIETLLAPDGAAPDDTAPAVVLRPHRPGDMGFVLASHGAVYAAEQGWGAGFEALVADILADFLRTFDPAREGCWIAERGGVPVGSVFLVDGGDGVAKLRLLLVTPEARGLGVGRRLVEACIAFARAHGYRAISLWTQSILVEARGLYASLGFTLVEQAPHCSFGHDLLGETWRLELG